MHIRVKYLRRLLEELVNKHGVIDEKKGLEDIAENIGITRDYLYKKIANPISRMKPHESIGLRDGIIKKLLKDIGFENPMSFFQFVDAPVSDQARSMIGSYYSYVRRNTKEGVLLRSPVLIYEKGKKIFLSLKGDRTDYVGLISVSRGVLSVKIENQEGKFFNHVYRIGNVNRPKILQGIFSGVTSTFDPIGGRVVLERRPEKADELKTKAIEIHALKKSRAKADKILASYFDKYADNNLQVKKSTSFEFGDLQ